MNVSEVVQLGGTMLDFLRGPSCDMWVPLVSLISKGLFVVQTSLAFSLTLAIDDHPLP